MGCLSCAYTCQAKCHENVVTCAEEGGSPNPLKVEAHQRMAGVGLELFCIELVKHNYKDIAGAKSAFQHFQKKKIFAPNIKVQGEAIAPTQHSDCATGHTLL